MNLLRTAFTIAMISMTIIAAYAAGDSLDKSDFFSASSTPKNGQVLILADLNEEGTAKLQALSAGSIRKEIKIDLGGETHRLKLRDSIPHNRIQIGPFSKEVAHRILEEINE